jgi:hypothetical protein
MSSGGSSEVASGLRDAVERLQAVVEQGGCHQAEEIVRSVLDLVPDRIDDEGDQRQVLRALEALRKWRCFALLAHFCERIAPHAPSPFDLRVHQFWAQAMVELGDDETALSMLEDMQSRTEPVEKRRISERVGLIGRVHKDRFVRHGRPDDLRASVRHYSQVFGLDVAWHGSNLIALTGYAERAGLALDGPTSAEWAAMTLEALHDKEEEGWTGWELATAGEAALARADSDAAADYFSRYWQRESSPFVLAGTERQLQTLWLPNNNDEQAKLIRRLVTELSVQRIALPGAYERFTAKQLVEKAHDIERATGAPEAVFGANSALTLAKVRKLLRKAAVVCRVKEAGDDDNETGGTGFLVDGASLSEELAGLKVVLTNHHVLHGDEASDRLLDQSDYTNSVHVDRAVAEFQYWGEEDAAVSFKLSSVVHSSPRGDLDFSIACFEAPPGDTVEGLTLSTDDKPFRSRNHRSDKNRGQVFVVGHPLGGSLTFSVNDNLVVDHELTDSLPEEDAWRRRIHYRAPTEGGSSGSPVFDHRRLEVVGVHRTGRAAPLRPDWPGRVPGENSYEANEAISTRSIREFLAAEAQGSRNLA